MVFVDAVEAGAPDQGREGVGIADVDHREAVFLAVPGLGIQEGPADAGGAGVHEEGAGQGLGHGRHAGEVIGGPDKGQGRQVPPGM